jgi:CO/xanthine dehydrogenase Mo-binding subunit
VAEGVECRRVRRPPPARASAVSSTRTWPTFARRAAAASVTTDLVAAHYAGRILNEKTARSQIIGSVVMGIGMTLLEETVFDAARIANATFGDYLIPVNADVPDLDVVFVGEPDRFSPIGIKGLGEVGLIGVSAAIANAVYHATGQRLRSLPIAVEKLLSRLA